MRRAVKGMLPHTKLGAQQLRKLKVYAGTDHPHEAQQPAAARGRRCYGMNQARFYEGTGRRKTSVARVRLLAGEGEVVVNGRSLEEHFGNAVDLNDIMMPFRVTGTEGRFNAMIKVRGRRHQGQAGAIRHGIARALLESDPEAARAAPPGRAPVARPAHEGAQEVRPQASPQGAAVHQALAQAASRITPAPFASRAGVPGRTPLAHAGAPPACDARDR